MKLTQANISKAKIEPGKAEAFFWDEEMPGFGLRLRVGGSRTFVAQYKLGTRHRRMSLGNASKVTADDARKAARQIFGKVAQGNDPASERATRVAEASVGFQATVADYLEVQAARSRPKTMEGTRHYLLKALRPLNGLALASITRATVAAELRRIAKDSGPSSADAARAKLSAFFAWAIGEGLCENNPVIGTNRAGGESRGRARVLTDTEVVAIWNAADPESEFGKIVRLLFLTACRRNEIGGLGGAEVALSDALIALPGERTKNKLPHDVPLSAPALAIAKTLGEGAGTLFGNSERGFNNWDRAKQQLDAAAGATDWTLHDIRRTAATRMADLGVQPHVIEAVLNHISGHKRGVAGVYNRSTYAKEKRAALEIWATHLLALVARAQGGNVVAIRTA